MRNESEEDSIVEESGFIYRDGKPITNFYIHKLQKYILKIFVEDNWTIL